MKRHLWLVAWSTLLIATPLMAQEPYPAYGYPSGYAAEPAYDTNRDTREFHLNPSDMMNGMSNPMRNMFGGSRRRYNAYPENRYGPPPVYPPAYGYPAYQPPQNTGYGRPAPTYGHQPAYPTQAEPTPAPAPESTADYDRQPPGVAGRLAPPIPAHGERYYFRPLDSNPPPGANRSPPAPPASQRFSPAYTEQGPAEPTTYPGQAQQTAQPDTEQTTVIHEGRAMKFRPLDKPGYTPDLDH
jgi:hypothetical protein